MTIVGRYDALGDNKPSALTKPERVEMVRLWERELLGGITPQERNRLRAYRARIAKGDPR